MRSSRVAIPWSSASMCASSWLTRTLVVIGSFGGSDLPPAWWLNLQRDPRASVLIRGTTSRVTARAATAEEHDRLWPLVTEANPGYARYQRRTARPIPIVLLTPEKE